ncbi:hypothetical protein [Pseudomonas sp. D2002]|uniref:XAC2610-related protein n=1 Tax=Pseudomonas sp. D2002 TaxID=2726980 RepID=UPI0015A3B0DE|nr:hypothetical protein [Pseudomonas sp. D2002]NWA81301.1 hypothetical protein [Pseudomonas sp. D2002]
MRSLFNGVLISLALTATAIAEPRSVSVNDPSGHYLVDVLFPEVPEDPGELAPALITVRDKNTLETLQQLHSPAANVPVDQNGKIDNWLLGPFSLLYFADFDLDGRQDLAIRNGNDPTQRYKPMFDVYLQDPQTQRWVLNAPLTKLAWETSSGMFSLSPFEGTLLSQVDRGCCWTRSTQWQMRNGELKRLSAYTQEEVPATESGENSSMPRGYLLRTTGGWKDGQWHEQPSLEGPVNQEVQSLSGTLDGTLPVQLWYQEQGAVIIGELRYTRSGSRQPIQLVGEKEESDGDNFLYLFESADDGHQTGIWRITRSDREPYEYGGTWVREAKVAKPERVIRLQPEAREPDYEKATDVARDQRSGHYQMRDDFLGRDGDLDVHILPERDAQGREVAEFTIRLKTTATGQEIVTAHHTVPMETENLIIVPEPLAPRSNGPYHIQLVRNFAVINHNAAPDNDHFFTGMYRKQPTQP